MNPIGANTWIWVSPLTDERLATLAPRFADWGFDVAELPIEDLGNWDPQRAADILREHGLGATVCAVMGPGRDLTGDSDDVIASTQDYLRGCVDVAVTVGSNVVGGPIYAPVGYTPQLDPDQRERMMAGLATALRPVADYAGERGVRLGVEPLNRFETSIINTVDQALDLCDRVGSDSLGIMLDTFHMNIEERDFGEAIRAVGDRLVHLQACANDRGAPGADHLDWPGIVAALRDIGYDDPICVESFTGENITIARAASIWRPLAPTQDQLATDGLAFLRQVLS